MEKDDYALFIDNSGSVGGSINYWDTVRDILAQYSKQISHYFLWNSNTTEVPKKAIENSINSRQGTGGTSPETVASEIVKRKMTRIILVTDGQVGDANVTNCDKIFDKAQNQGFKLSKSICFMVSSDNGSLNMSVTCPFTRNCQNKVFTKEKNAPLTALVQYTAEDYKILDELQEISIENFEAKYPIIEGLIIALNMGKAGNIPLKDQLVKMKTRMVKELSKKMAKVEDYSMTIRERLEGGYLKGALEVASVMTKKYFNESVTSDLEKKISQLINLCGDLRGMYSIGQIKSNKMATAQTVKDAKLDIEVEIQDLSSNLIECPIILDEDVPQILIDECEPFLLDVDKKIVDDIAACPLRILNYPELKLKFKKSLSNFTGVKYADKFLKNPFTQNRLLGAIPLGTHKSHVEVGNNTLAKLISGGKILGNLNLYYAVVWYLIEQDEIEYLKPIKANATEHLVFRLRNSLTMCGLSGLAQFVTTQVSSDVAVWYCANSGYFNQPTDRDTFRFHLFNLPALIKMTKALGYPLHQGLQKHYVRTKALMHQLSSVKRLKTNKKKEFKGWFTGLYQNGFFLDKDAQISEKFRELEVCAQFIPIDGEASYEQIQIIRNRFPKYYERLSNEEIYYISTLVDASKSASDIFLDYNIVVPPLPKAEVNWCYGLEKSDKSQVNFNRKTLRPFYKIENETWQDVALRIFNVNNVNRLFKGCKYIENYVEKYTKLPNFVELVLFYYNRYVQAGKKNTLPFLTEKWTHELVGKFCKAAQGKTIEEVVKILRLSRPIAQREQMEKIQE